MTKTATKLSRSEKIRRHLLANPNAKVAAVAAKFKTTPPVVYAIRSKMNFQEFRADAVVPVPVREPAPVLTKADTIGDMLKERGERYGTFAEHAAISQLIKQAIFTNLDSDKYAEMDADQIEALEMIAHKIARIINGDHHYVDNWKDIAGYAKLVSDRLETGIAT